MSLQYRPGQDPTETPINLPTTQQLRSVAQPQQPNNIEFAETSTDIVAQIDHIFYMLKVFGINTDPATSNMDYLKSTSEFIELVNEVKMALFVIRNSLFKNLSTNQHGEIDRTPANIDSLRTNIEKAAEKLIKISDSVPPLPIKKNELTPAPEYPITVFEDQSAIKPLLEEILQYLQDFIAAHRTRLLLETKATTLELNSAVNTLNILEDDTLNLEPAADEAFSAELNSVWGPILTSLSSKLAEFDHELRSHYQSIAENLLSYTSEESLEAALQSHHDAENNIQRTIDRRETIASLPAVKIFMEIYRTITSNPELKWITNPQRELEETKAETATLSNITTQRRQIFGKKPR